MKMLLRMTRELLRPHVGRLVALFLITAAVSATPYAFSFLGKWLVDEALQVSGPSAAGAASQSQQVRYLAIFLATSLGLHVVGTALGLWSELIKNRMNQRVTYDLRRQVQGKFTRMEPHLFGREQVGQLMTRILDDTSGLPANLTNLIVNVVTQVAMLVLGAILLFRLNAKLAPFALMALPFYGVACVVFLPRIRRNAEELRERGARFQGHIVERLTNISTVKNYAAEDRELAFFGQTLDDNLGLQRAQQKLSLGFSTITTLVTSLGTLAVLCFGFINIRDGDMQLGETLAFYQITGQLFVPISALVGMATVVQSIQILGERIYETLDARATLGVAPDATPLADVRGDIAFEGVSLQYAEGGPLAVQDVTLEIPAGTTACVVGPTGSGKSSLLMLVLRFYDPSAGAVRLDGVDLRRIDLNDLRTAVGLVTRECRVFRGTVADNIAYGRPEATQAEIEAAARSVGLHDWTMEQDQQYRTAVGRGGVDMDAEELVRINVARALVARPSVVCVDDAFAVVSEDVEGSLRRAIDSTLDNPTLLIATSRVSVCQDADFVIVVRRGRVVEVGTHADLLMTPGVYRRMYLLQMGMQDVPRAS
jgi:ABC-type multidrug transport system fused ATPase/permease subunit